jgi:hypothetical protein
MGAGAIDREARSCLLARVRWATSLGVCLLGMRRSKADHGEGGNRKWPEVRVRRPTGSQNHYRRGRSRFAVLGFVMQEWKVRKARGRRSEIGRAVAKRDTSHERWMEAGRSNPLGRDTSGGAPAACSKQVQARATVPAKLHCAKTDAPAERMADGWQWMRLALEDPLGQAGRFVTLSICCLLGPSFLLLLRFHAAVP